MLISWRIYLRLEIGSNVYDGEEREEEVLVPSMVGVVRSQLPIPAQRRLSANTARWVSSASCSSH